MFLRRLLKLEAYALQDVGVSIIFGSQGEHRKGYSDAHWGEDDFVVGLTGQFMVQAEGEAGEVWEVVVINIRAGLTPGTRDLTAQACQQAEAPRDGGCHCPARERRVPHLGQATR